jgi:hypothetical protein
MAFFIIDFSKFQLFSSVSFSYTNKYFKLFWTQGGHIQFTIIKITSCVRSEAGNEWDKHRFMALGILLSRSVWRSSTAI